MLISNTLFKGCFNLILIINVQVIKQSSLNCSKETWIITILISWELNTILWTGSVTRHHARHQPRAWRNCNPQLIEQRNELYSIFVHHSCNQNYHREQSYNNHRSYVIWATQISLQDLHGGSKTWHSVKTTLAITIC
jgi:hypothetical protein